MDAVFIVLTVMVTASVTAVSIVRMVLRDRTRRLLAREQPSPAITDRLAQIEGRLAKMAEDQRQLQATQEWQQKLLETPARGEPAPE